ncbi:MAG: alanine--tRNA ligase [Planctomycetota bacterium]|jgi:alanyl-tRNA synthetase
MGVKSCDQIRREFIGFFEGKGHTSVPSTPVVPVDDPTLMFTNAGMNQFKDVFLGMGSRPFRRAVDSQKCIRVSGKHNDLEEVGRDTYHHTFFEMLGNWSFGDYFKREAIGWAWELLTEVWGLPRDRLYATYFNGYAQDGLEADAEAARLWAEATDIEPSHIMEGSKEDNFWEMGAVGPCGPCSEVHIDLTPDGSGGELVNAGDPRVIEIWNLVFVQFERDESGKLSPLPAQHIDTGMGLERIVAVLQGKTSNYDTDLFGPLMSHIAQLSDKQYEGKIGKGAEVDNAFRVVADHARMLTFAITDGAKPSNDGRGYVLRRILRRAARFGRQHFDQHEPFIYKLVPTIVETMGEAFSELREHSNGVSDLIREEEESFGRTLDRGIALFEQAASGGGRKISAEDAFKLYDTYGFPLDLTVQMADEWGMMVDTENYKRLVEEAREKARAGSKEHDRFDTEAAQALKKKGAKDTDDSMKYCGELECQTFITSFARHTALDDTDSAKTGQDIVFTLAQTCFYAEQGGQVSDTGVIQTEDGKGEIEVTSVRKVGDTILHKGRVTKGEILPASKCVAKVETTSRLATMINHTATHLMHWALREVLGDQVKQHGSVVDPARLRFDFDHNHPVKSEEIAKVEQLVNEKICADLKVSTQELPIEDARKLPGVRAFFGEKYGDTVRVVSIGDGFSTEFCGGTHIRRTGEIGEFVLTAEASVSKGIRRVVGITGEKAQRAIDVAGELLMLADSIQQGSEDQVEPGLVDLQEKMLDVEIPLLTRIQLRDTVAKLQQMVKDHRKQLQKGAAADIKGIRQELLKGADKVGDHAIIVGEVPDVPVEQIREIADWLRTEAGSAAVCLAANREGKPLLIAAMTKDLVGKGLKAGDLIKHIVPAIDGRGGGKPDLAQAGGKKVEGIAEALAGATQWIKDKLG